MTRTSRLPSMNRLFGLLLGLALPTVAVLAGCSDAGPKRYDLSGKVTWAGKPIPVGSIVFEPDNAKGNKGPAGFGKIKDGKYDTRAGGKGVVGGPHVVRIVGFDGQAKPDSPDGATLFPEYTTPADLPKETTTKDFEVPQTGGGAPTAKTPNYSDV